MIIFAIERTRNIKMVKKVSVPKKTIYVYIEIYLPKFQICFNNNQSLHNKAYFQKMVKSNFKDQRG